MLRRITHIPPECLMKSTATEAIRLWIWPKMDSFWHATANTHARAVLFRFSLQPPAKVFWETTEPYKIFAKPLTAKGSSFRQLRAQSSTPRRYWGRRAKGGHKSLALHLAIHFALRRPSIVLADKPGWQLHCPNRPFCLLTFLWGTGGRVSCLKDSLALVRSAVSVLRPCC